VISDSAFVIAVSERASSSSIAETLAQFDAKQAELTKLQRERDEYKKLAAHLREENERLKPRPRKNRARAHDGAVQARADHRG
jgi:hypothetical protein